MRQLVALDSNVFIAFLSQEPVFFESASKILLQFENGEIDITYSSLVFGEVLRMPGKKPLDAIEQFFERLDGHDIPADKPICVAAAELRKDNSALKLPDAIHLATAIQSKAAVFMTADKQLAGIGKEYLPIKLLQESA